MNPRVVITGMGALSGAGASLAEARARFTGGICCLSPIRDPRAAQLKARYAGLLEDFAAVKAALPVEHQSHDRHVVMALAAARETLAQAGIRPADLGSRLGLVFATCSGPMLSIERHYERVIQGDLRISQAELFAKRYYAAARILAGALGFEGLTLTVATACTAGTGAIALAADLIRCGLLDAVLAGGADAFSTSTLAGFDSLKATSSGKCAPFSKPYGLNLGEAAAFVVLETDESARRRGARVCAELIGSGMSNDAYHCSAPEPTGRGLALAMRRALADAGLDAAAISYINAHGTGTEANDKAETRALRRVFEARTDQLPVSSTKSLVGHCLGAAGVIETIASIVCAQAGVLPPTANFTEPREGCGIDCVPQAGRSWPELHTFLSNNLAFGGHNASLVVTVPPDPEGGVQPAPASPDVIENAVSTRICPATEPICLTGCGVVSSLGAGRAAFLEALRVGMDGTRPVTLPGGQAIQAGLVNDDAVDKCDRRLDLRHMDRSSKWATVAARLALREAAFPDNPPALAELGAMLHLSAGPSWAESEFLTSFLSHDHQVSQLAAFPYIVPCSVAGNVCRALRLTGHNLTISGGPGAGLLGLGPAVAALRCGHAEALLSGAVDELSERILTDGFMAGGCTDVPGEGAAVLLLETTCHAQARGARPLAVIRGLAFSGASDAPPNSGAMPARTASTVLDALAQAGISTGQVGAVCAHGPQPACAHALKTLCPDWPGRTLDVSRQTGRLEAAQPLVDLAAALWSAASLPADRRFVLCLSAFPESGTAAIVFEPRL